LGSTSAVPSPVSSQRGAAVLDTTGAVAGKKTQPASGAGSRPAGRRSSTVSSVKLTAARPATRTGWRRSARAKSAAQRPSGSAAPATGRVSVYSPSPGMHSTLQISQSARARRVTLAASMTAGTVMSSGSTTVSL
jgi:hypothetical protein